MPIQGDAKKVMASMKDQYGPEKGERIFYATANKQNRKPETWKKKACLATEYFKLAAGKPRIVEPPGVDIQKLEGVGDSVAFAPEPPGPDDMPPPMKRADRIPGGLADGKQPSDYPQTQLLEGQRVEMEHTNDPTVAREIAMDHLEESDRYYIPYLRDMERRMEGEAPKKAAEFPATEYFKLAAGVPGGLNPGYSAAMDRLRRTPPRPVSSLSNTLMRIPKSELPLKKSA